MRSLRIVFNLKFVDGICPGFPDTIGECYPITFEIRIYRKHPACSGLNLAQTILHEMGHSLLFRFGDWSDDAHLLYDCFTADVNNLLRRIKTRFFIRFLRGEEIQKMVNETPRNLDCDLPRERSK